MEEVEIPSLFLCPISLELMRDPVSLSTGITYDRESIERWIISGKHHVCPVTNQPLPDSDLTPNHTLRRLIQSWCVTSGLQQFPTPRPQLDKTQIISLLNAATDHPHSLITSLRQLKDIIGDSQSNKRCMEATPGALDFLASILTTNILSKHQDIIDSSTEALHILYSLKISEQGLLDLISNNNGFIDSLIATLQRGSNSQSRAHATFLIKSILDVLAPAQLVSLRVELYRHLVYVISDRISYQATKAAIQILGGLCPWGRNRVKAVEAGAVSVLIELALDEPERKVCEMVFVVLDRLCGCSEGRAEVVGHAAGIAVVSKKILRVSELASERAVRILHSISKFSSTRAVVQEMLQVGVVTKLFLLIQVHSGSKVKEMAREILRLHSRDWKHSPCVSPQLRAAYPCS